MDAHNIKKSGRSSSPWNRTRDRHESGSSKHSSTSEPKKANRYEDKHGGYLVKNQNRNMKNSGRSRSPLKGTRERHGSNLLEHFGTLESKDNYYSSESGGEQEFITPRYSRKVYDSNAEHPAEHHLRKLHKENDSKRSIRQSRRDLFEDDNVRQKSKYFQSENLEVDEKKMEGSPPGNPGGRKRRFSSGSYGDHEETEKYFRPEISTRSKRKHIFSESDDLEGNGRDRHLKPDNKLPKDHYGTDHKYEERKKQTSKSASSPYPSKKHSCRGDNNDVYQNKYDKSGALLSRKPSTSSFSRETVKTTEIPRHMQHGLIADYSSDDQKDNLRQGQSAARERKYRRAKKRKGEVENSDSDDYSKQKERFRQRKKKFDSDEYDSGSSLFYGVPVKVVENYPLKNYNSIYSDESDDTNRKMYPMKEEDCDSMENYDDGERQRGRLSSPSQKKKEFGDNDKYDARQTGCNRRRSSSPKHVFDAKREQDCYSIVGENYEKQTVRKRSSSPKDYSCAKREQNCYSAEGEDYGRQTVRKQSSSSENYSYAKREQDRYSAEGDDYGRQTVWKEIGSPKHYSYAEWEQNRYSGDANDNCGRQTVRKRSSSPKIYSHAKREQNYYSAEGDDNERQTVRKRTSSFENYSFEKREHDHYSAEVDNYGRQTEGKRNSSPNNSSCAKHERNHYAECDDNYGRQTVRKRSGSRKSYSCAKREQNRYSAQGDDNGRQTLRKRSSSPKDYYYPKRQQDLRQRSSSPKHHSYTERKQHDDYPSYDDDTERQTGGRRRSSSPNNYSYAEKSEPDHFSAEHDNGRQSVRKVSRSSENYSYLKREQDLRKHSISPKLQFFPQTKQLEHCPSKGHDTERQTGRRQSISPKNYSYAKREQDRFSAERDDDNGRQSIGKRSSSPGEYFYAKREQDRYIDSGDHGDRRQTGRRRNSSPKNYSYPKKEQDLRKQNSSTKQYSFPKTKQRDHYSPGDDTERQAGGRRQSSSCAKRGQDYYSAEGDDNGRQSFRKRSSSHKNSSHKEEQGYSSAEDDDDSGRQIVRRRSSSPNHYSYPEKEQDHYSSESDDGGMRRTSQRRTSPTSSYPVSEHNRYSLTNNDTSHHPQQEFYEQRDQHSHKTNSSVAEKPIANRTISSSKMDKICKNDVSPEITGKAAKEGKGCTLVRKDSPLPQKEAKPSRDSVKNRKAGKQELPMQVSKETNQQEVNSRGHLKGPKSQQGKDCSLKVSGNIRYLTDEWKEPASQLFTKDHMTENKEEGSQKGHTPTPKEARTREQSWQVSKNLQMTASNDSPNPNVVRTRKPSIALCSEDEFNAGDDGYDDFVNFASTPVRQSSPVENTKKHMCAFCDDVFDDKEKLQKHTYTHVGNGNDTSSPPEFSCFLCEFQTGNCDDFSNHMKDVHQPYCERGESEELVDPLDLLFHEHNMKPSLYRFKKTLTDNNLVEIEIPGNGFCFVSSLLITLKERNIPRDHLMFLLEVTNDLRTHSVQYAEFYPEAAKDYEGFLQRCTNFLQRGDYTNDVADVCIGACANALGVNLLIFQKNGQHMSMNEFKCRRGYSSSLYLYLQFYNSKKKASKNLDAHYNCYVDQTFAEQNRALINSLIVTNEAGLNNVDLASDRYLAELLQAQLNSRKENDVRQQVEEQNKAKQQNQTEQNEGKRYVKFI